MAQPETSSFLPLNVAELLAHVGDIPAERVRLRPVPGTATEDDVLRVHAQEKRLCELVDGVLVEKTVGTYESRLAVLIAYYVQDFLRQHDLGVVLGADGMLLLAPGLVRIPDVAFISRDQLSGEKMRRQAIAQLYPDLAIEVLSRGNTEREMTRKLADYFAAGTRLVWLLDPEQRTMRVYTAEAESQLVGEAETLSGEDVLPGFTLSLTALFAEADRFGGAVE